MKSLIYYRPDGAIQQVAYTYDDDVVPIDMPGTSVLVVDGHVDGINSHVAAGAVVAGRVPLTLAQLKDAKWEEIKAARDRIEFGSFTWDGSTFDADPTSTSRIMGAFSLALAATMGGQTYSVDWTLKDNTVRALSGADMVAVGVTLGNIVKQAHETAGQLRDAINAAADEATLETIAWPA